MIILVVPYLLVLSVALLIGLGVVWWFYRQLSKSKAEIQALGAKLEGQKTMVAEVLADPFKYKLDPHLLKNALNAIQSHAYQSYYALDKLSNILDYILYESDTRFVPLKDEIAFAQNLIEINRLKISPLFDLHVRKKIGEEFADLPIAPFVTINPIENAFKHADVQSEHSFISVVFEVRDNRFLLSVSNKIQPKTMQNNSHRGGLGNKAFISRLDQIYGQDYRLQTETDGDVYQVKLEIKLHADR
ncbi:sensor histidine kinase [Parapedobacter koreensis]|uniref:Histidine kinase n=1 Tax=Parapedobacter koreensis TaxID=332977 RepID=A0A1H7GRX2_9SPHI|nr:histidine kinase [Parapedobacter koreensis]SEK40257.1 Histidine kinase [Parapedobacter koreensis]